MFPRFIHRFCKHTFTAKGLLTVALNCTLAIKTLKMYPHTGMFIFIDAKMTFQKHV